MVPHRPGRICVRAAALLALGALAMPAPALAQGITNLGFQNDPYLMDNTKPSEGPASRYVRISHAGAVNTPDGPALQIHVTNIADEPIRVAVRFDAPGRRTDCSAAAHIDPAAGQRYLCRQEIIRSDTPYPITVEVMTPGRSKPVERIRRSYRFGKDHLARVAGRTGGGLDG